MAPTLPLARFKVLDLTRARSGPTAVRQFADWGADVLMIEEPAETAAVTVARSSSDSQNRRRNKRSVTLDLTSDEGRAILLRLAETADVPGENVRPDAKRRLSIDYESARRVN